MRKRTFTEIYVSAGRARAPSERNRISVGRASARIRIRIDGHLPADDKCGETGMGFKRRLRYSDVDVNC